MKTTTKSGLLRSTMIASAIALGGTLPAMIATTAYAQDFTSGAILGTVESLSGAPIVGATVTLTSDRGTTRTAVTDSDGEFRAPRLPIGSYDVEISAPGFSMLQDQQVMSSLGARNTYTFALASDTETDEVIATGTITRQVDFQSTTSGINVNIDDIQQLIPIGRDTTSVALLAPGTTQGDSTFGNLASFSGSSVAENIEYVNGLNVTEFRNFLGGSTVPFDFIEQVEVKTSGYGAEFGRSTGGVINNVTKSGSNEFEFAANVYWQPDFLRNEAKDINENINSLESRDSITYNVFASGPIIEDKLFFAALYQWEDNDSDSYTVTRRNDISNKNEFWGVKVDFEPIPGHRFEATLFDDEGEQRVQGYAFDGGDTVNIDGHTYDIPYIDIGSRDVSLLTGNPDASVAVTKSGGLNQIYRYTGVLTDWFTISAQWGENPRDRTEKTDPDDSSLPRIIDSRNNQGFFSVPGFASATTFGSDSDNRKAWRVDADVAFSFLGDHNVRVGIDREDLTSFSSTQVSGGTYWRYYDCTDNDPLAGGGTGCLFPDGEIANGDTYVRYWDEEGGGTFETTQTAQYIQDEWQVTDDLTLLLGLRNETFENNDANGDTFTKIENQLAPRLGFNYIPTDAANSRVFGSYGRNYLPVATNTSIRLASPERFILTYFPTQGPDANWNPIGVTLGQTPAIWTRTFDDGVLPNPATIASLDLEPMYQDEFTLGYEHRMDNGWNFGVTGIYRDLKSIIEDIGIDHALAAWGQANGKDQADIDDLLDPNTPLYYILHNPGGDLRFQTDFFTGGALEDVTLSAADLGYPEAKRTYKAIELTAEREFDGKWGVDGSYTMSWSEGNTEGSVNSDLGQDDAGLTQDFDIPGTLIGADGYTANDRRHRLKLRGTYQFIDAIRAGANFTLESPRKFGCFGNLPRTAQLDAAFGDLSVDQNFLYHNRYGADYWFCDGEPSPRGSNFEGEWTTNLDMNLRLSPSFSDDLPGDFVLQIDVFNVFNNQSVSERDFNKEFDQTTIGAAIDQNLEYGNATNRAAPRRVRLTARYRY